MGVDFTSFLVCGWKINSKALLKYLHEEGVTRETCTHYDKKRDKKQKMNPCTCGSACWVFKHPENARIINVRSTDNDVDFEECEFWINLGGGEFNKASQVIKLTNSDSYNEILKFVEKLGGDSKEEPEFSSFHYIS
jgi:hypothetical protein